MKVKELIAILQECDAEADVYYRDPNFGGAYHVPFTQDDVEVWFGQVLIRFPFEEPVGYT